MLIKQILFSPDADGGTPKSEPIKRLATRYGIPEADVAALLYGSRAPKSEASGSDTEGKTMAEDFRPNFNIEPPRQRGWSPVNVLSLIVGILGIMALTIILVSVLNRRHFEHFGGMMPPPPAMPMPEQPHPAMGEPPTTPKDSALSQKPEDIPPPAATNEIAAKPAPKHKRSTHASTAFTTSNSMEAQEHLAEMRADGNSKAKIRASSKNGVTIYSVK